MAPPACNLTEAQVNDVFLAAPPAIAKEMFNLSLRVPNFVLDLPAYKEFPTGQGTQMQQLIYRGEMPAIERGFANWNDLSNNTGCDSCAGPGCGYNWTTFGGSGLERKIIKMMSRDFRSNPYCIKQIQTTAQFMEVFDQIVKNLFQQIKFFKEQNVVFNYLTSILQKFVVDSGGFKFNNANVFEYPNVGTVKLSALNIDMLEFMYESMRRNPAVIPFDVVNNSPIFSIMASAQLLQRLYRDDPELRQDVRFSGLANANLTKYNFISTIRDMFIAAPILTPRRFNIAAGVPVEVSPVLNGIPMEVGSFTGQNPAYESATHEEVILHGKSPFDIYYMPTETSLGQNTSFGPEFSFLDSWAWINALTDNDPMRRVGYFVSSATIGFGAPYSEGQYGILVERVSLRLAAVFNPTPLCPPVDPECSNEIPASDCPCPLISGWIADPFTANKYIITLTVPTDAAPTETIQFGIDTGGYLVGTVVAVSSDALTVSVTFPAGTDLGICDHFTTVFCENTLACYSQVVSYVTNASDSTRIDLTLASPIKAVTPAQVVTLTYGDGTTASATVVSVNMSTGVWVVDIGATAFSDQVGGVYSICVPTATDAACPGCDGLSYTACSEA